MTNTQTGLWFDGTDDHLTVADHAELSWGTAWSLSLWFKMDWDCAAGARLMARTGYADIMLDEGNNNSKVLSFAITGGSQHRLNAVRFVPQRLYHLVITLTDDGSDCDYVVYVDGNSKTSGTLTGENLAGDVAAALYFAIGADGSSNPFKGFLSNIFVSEDVLTAAEVTSLYNSGAGTLDYSGVDNHGAEWNIDEGSGTSIDNETSANISLTATNGPVWQSEWDFKGREGGVWETSDANHEHFGWVKILEIDWVDATAAGHSAVIKDWHDVIIFESEADADNFMDRAYPNKWYYGVKIDTLSSGKLLIHVG